jgi:hypothetical protein
MLSPSQVAAQKAAAQALKRQKVPPRSQSPVGGSSDNDDPSRANEWISSQTKGCLRRNKFFKGVTSSVPALPAPEPQKALPAPELLALPGPEPRIPTPVNSDDEEVSEEQKRMIARGKKMARRGTAQGRSSPKPTEGAKALHPMATRKTASRAGSLRSGGGSGQTDTCVA